MHNNRAGFVENYKVDFERQHEDKEVKDNQTCDSSSPMFDLIAADKL